jgi:hypothetical protein
VLLLTLDRFERSETLGEGDRKWIVRGLIEPRVYARGQSNYGFDSLKEIEGRVGWVLNDMHMR